MINNQGFNFSVDEFIKSLQAIDTRASNKVTKLPVKEAETSGKFIKASLGAFRNSDDGSIWKLETADDGKQYIVRTEDTDNVVQGGWTAAVNRTGSSVTLSYDKTPIRSFAADEFSYSPENARLFAEVLIDNATNDPKKFAKKLLSTIAFDDKIALQKRYALFREV